jgi:hypothetical protein
LRRLILRRITLDATIDTCCTETSESPIALQSPGRDARAGRERGGGDTIEKHGERWKESCPTDQKPASLTAARIADYYGQLVVSGPELSTMTSTVLGSQVKSDAVAHGIQSGLRFLSLFVGGIGLPVTALLAGRGATKAA